MAVPRSRIVDLMKVQCRIFSHSFNPEGLRLGNHILRQRLKGPSLVGYYPRKMGTLQDLRKAYPEYTIVDEAEEERLEAIRMLKARGKGPPKKKRTAEEGKKHKKRK